MRINMSATELARQWHVDFNRFAGDLYPNRYTFPTCQVLADQGIEATRRIEEKGAVLPVHYYLTPEFHEIATKLGDSLALCRFIKETRAKMVYYQAVAFMAQTGKIMVPEARFCISDSTRNLGCSLVFGTNHAWLENWQRQNPDGIFITYINSDPYTKGLGSLNIVSTSRNTDKAIAYAARKYPDRKILVLPDKFLGFVMKNKAIQALRAEGRNIDPSMIEVYMENFGGYRACCYVHEQLGNDAVEVAMIENPEAELMIHPECGCASSCLYKLQEGLIPHDRAFFLSTEQMIERAMISNAKMFLVATEPGLIYALRKRMPEKTFLPVSAEAQCQFMKANTFDKLLRSLAEDRIEIVICEGCTKCLNPRAPYEDDRVIHIPGKVADRARQGIERMLEIV